MATAMTVTEIEGRLVVAKKSHRCTPYFHLKCKGTGVVNAGDQYFTPENDCIDPFHPYRICLKCVEAARAVSCG